MIVGDRIEIDGVVYEVRYWDDFKKAWALRDEKGEYVYYEESD